MVRSIKNIAEIILVGEPDYCPDYPDGFRSIEIHLNNGERIVIAGCASCDVLHVEKRDVED
ncbi:MAG: hypothetical protein ACFFD4_02265 [Candidatus Odinarchaeota archaeon]